MKGDVHHEKQIVKGKNGGTIFKGSYVLSGKWSPDNISGRY